MQIIRYPIAPGKEFAKTKVLFLVTKKVFVFLWHEIKPTGRIPGNNMRVKESKELKELATLSGKTAKQVSETVVTELIKRKIIEDIPDNWGLPVSECYERDVTVAEFAGVIRSIGITVVRSEHLDALLECVLIGGGDCPECGGEMEVTDGEYKQTGGDGYLTPPEYTALWEEKTCTHCGHTESNEPSY